MYHPRSDQQLCGYHNYDNDNDNDYNYGDSDCKWGGLHGKRHLPADRGDLLHRQQHLLHGQRLLGHHHLLHRHLHAEHRSGRWPHLSVNKWSYVED